MSFISQGSGTWGGYCATIPSLAFEIDDDVSLQSASSGVVNPLTVLGMIEICRERKLKGIIHTAAASSLGRMLNKVCLKEKVPLLNLVRRQEHAEILKKEGAENVLITTGDWQDKFKEYVEKDGFDCFFDALGGGEITTFLMENMKIPSGIFIYGALTGEPLVLNRVGKLHYGLKIEGYLVGIWWFSAPEEVKKRIRENYSAYLKNDLATKTVKELTFNEYDEALELSINNTLEGKVLLKPL